MGIRLPACGSDGKVSVRRRLHACAFANIHVFIYACRYLFITSHEYKYVHVYVTKTCMTWLPEVLAWEQALTEPAILVM
jgi:hypothetical protein